MVTKNNFSIYDAENNKRINNPLKEILPKSDEYGWGVARNLKKILNHLDLIKEKENISNQLRLNKNIDQKVLELMKKHINGLTTTEEVIKNISITNKINKNEIKELLKKYSSITHIEFHPSDNCNLKCIGCTYGHDRIESKPKNINFSFKEVNKIKLLKPKSIIIVGGGEPTLYKYGKYFFGDLISKITDDLPNIQLGLISNGTHIPKGDWQKYFKWARLSVDGSSRKTYLEFRGQDLFEKVINNFMRYVQSEIKQVGMSFLYSKININEYLEFAKIGYEKTNQVNPNLLKKVDISYRPFRSLERQSEIDINKKDIEKLTEKIKQSYSQNHNFKNFLQNQTNITAFLGGNYQPVHEFSKCYYSQIFHILRPNGDLIPCFTKVTQKNFKLGNLITDPLEKIALNSLYVSLLNEESCEGEKCKQCHINYMIENGLNNTILPSESPEMKKDMMF